jgi:rare lipoprotein A
MRRIVLGAASFMRVLRRPIHAGFVLVTLAAMFVAGCGHHSARVNAPIAPARIGSTETGVASWYGVPYDGRRAASGEVYDMRQLTAAHRQLPFQTWVEVTNLSNGKKVDVRINDRGPFVKGRIVDLSQAAARDIDMLRAGTARVRLKVIPPPNPPATSSRTLPANPLSAPPREARGEPAETIGAPAIVPAVPAAPSAEPPIADAAPGVIPPAVTAPADTAPADTASPGTAATSQVEPALTPPARTATAAGDYAVQAGAFSDPARAESLRAALQNLFTDTHVAPSIGRTPTLWRVIVGHQMTSEQAAALAVRVRRESGTAIVVPEPAPNN